MGLKRKQWALHDNSRTPDQFDEYGEWLVLAEYGKNEHGKTTYWCRCQLCGNEYEVVGASLTNGLSTKCVRCANVKDLTGQVFGRLEVLKRAGSDKSRRATWKCQCDCGNTSVHSAHSLKNGTISCGCYKAERQSETMTSYNNTVKWATKPA